MDKMTNLCKLVISLSILIVYVQAENVDIDSMVNCAACQIVASQAKNWKCKVTCEVASYTGEEYLELVFFFLTRKELNLKF